MIQAARISGTRLATTSSVGTGVGFTRNFSSTTALAFPQPNDQDDIIKRIDTAETKFRTLDGDIEEFTKELMEKEELVQDGDEPTELSKILQRREDNKDILIGRHEQARDRELLENDNVRGDKSILLNMMQRCTDRDIETLDIIKSELDPSDSDYDTADDLIERAESQKTSLSELHTALHENDLAPINSSDAQTDNDDISSPRDSSSDYQDSSDIERDYNDYTDDID